MLNLEIYIFRVKASYLQCNVLYTVKNADSIVRFTQSGLAVRSHTIKLCERLYGGGSDYYF